MHVAPPARCIHVVPLVELIEGSKNAPFGL